MTVVIAKRFLQTACGGVKSGLEKKMRFALKLAESGVFVCAAFISGVSFAQDYKFVTNDPVRAQLLTMGKPGLTVALARDHVTEILQSKNSCSAWFQEVDPNAASTFASLKFIIETNGPHEVLVLRSDSGEMLWKQPYAARALENAGRNSIVALNAKGAFFVRTAEVLRQGNIGSSFHLSGWLRLEVGSYRGDTLAAQITILLHELGHVVGRLAEDSDELSGQSGRNTAEVLRYCRAQIKAAQGSPLHSRP
jgi:hypothetical protein